MRRHRNLLFLVGLVAACSSATPPTAPDAMPVAPGTMAPMGMGVTGRFVKTRYDVTGTATVVIENGVGVIELSLDFSISQTPGPYLYLNTTNNPNTGQPIRIANLRGKSGAQRFTFTVPAGVRYTWLVIWCDPFNVPMAEAAITPVP
jgi:Electron transfer DM13